MEGVVDLGFCQKLPKIELHAHLNGSISEATMEQLIDMKKRKEPTWEPKHEKWKLCYDKTDKTSSQSVFQVFSLIHEVSQTEEAAYMITQDVIREFALDNVKYLELRTTPRNVPTTGMTKHSYIEAVLRGISVSMTDPSLDIQVRLLLAIDRRTTLEDAEDTVDLAVEYHNRGGVVVGLDYSGDPNHDAFDFLPVFRDAQSRGLRLAFHLAEIDRNHSETVSLLQLPPDRIGHGVHIHEGTGPTREMVELVRKQRIPLELCLTSNLVCQLFSSPEKHHFKFWHDSGHPICICTDDKGVFSTSLSEEFYLIAKTFSLGRQEVWNLAATAIDYIFAGEEVRNLLQQKFMTVKKEIIPLNTV